MQNTHLQDKIIFFDGHCMLCNHTVDIVLKLDRKQRLKFASLQSELAKKILPKQPGQADDTVIFFNDGKIFIKSTAILNIAGYLGFPYTASRIFYLLPRPVRDWFYDFISRHRFKWFGKRPTCRVPDRLTEGRILG